MFGSDAFRLDARAILSISQFTVLISVCYRLQISLWPHFQSDPISVAKMPSAAASGNLCKHQHLGTKGLIYPTALLRRSSTRRAEGLIAFLNRSIEKLRRNGVPASLKRRFVAVRLPPMANHLLQPTPLFQVYTYC